MRPSFKIEVVSVDPNPAGDGQVDARIRVLASWFFILASVLVTLWFNIKTRKGGVKAQTVA